MHLVCARRRRQTRKMEELGFCFLWVLGWAQKVLGFIEPRSPVINVMFL
ncbi:hypothetical protein HanRHA438_Chr16g0765891 [Helianthus annuus]|nr:hypothetical protein HanRHA438_Chr16g0765891 [Helianthus annuus]